jgi:hypothetical protein
MNRDVRFGTRPTYIWTQKTSLGNGQSTHFADTTRPFPLTITSRCRFKRSGKRNDIFLATKFAITREAERPVNGDPEYVKASCEKSLKRLGGTCSSSGMESVL